MPATIAPPAANYVHAVVSKASQRMLHTSGVVPIAPDGSTPTEIGAQAEVVWANISVLLANAEMSVSDIVSVTTYVVVGQLDALGLVMGARDVALGDHRAASTLVTVPTLARPEWLLEIAVIASN